MKKVLGIALTMGMIVSVLITNPIKEEVIPEEEETPEIIETVDILTRADFEQLYTCKQDIRKDDKNIIELSYNDAQLLLSVGRSEGGSGLDGQLWCMNTVYNRYENGWGDSLWGILNDGDQFTVVSSGAYLKADVNSNSHIALAMLESGIDPTEGALYWESNTNSPNSWHKKNLTFIKEVDGNLFYR